MQTGWDQIVGAIIRPPRFTNYEHLLGPKVLRVGQSEMWMERQDAELVNAWEHTLMVSEWSPCNPDHREGDHVQDGLPVVIYLHGNSSCRIDPVHNGILGAVANMSCCSLVAFDCRCALRI